ncbi:MAG: type II secretion system F family protein [Halobacteriovoraceae bacterium]|nr:type II secretion system F family protein [Halobacteriovoraceae bacterium]
MGAYKYEGFNRDGKKVTGAIEAQDLNDARRLLRRGGIRATKVQKPSILEVDLGAFLSEKTGMKQFSDKDVARFTKQLSTLIDAGVPIMQSLEILYKQEKNPGLRKALMRIARNVGDGKSLFEALEVEKGFEKLYCHLVRAGEVAGILNEILEKLAVFLEKRIALKKKVKSALTYPSIVVAVGITVITGLMAFVVPQFVDMIKESGQEIPGVTLFVMNVSAFFENNLLYIIGTIIFSAIGFMYGVRTENGKKIFDKAILKVPLIGQVVIKGSLSSFSQTLSTMLGSGISIVDALDICADTIDNTYIARDLKKVRMSVIKGKNLAEPLKRITYFPPLIAQMIHVGESTGALDDMLKKVSNVFEIEVEGSVQNMTQLIEPIILVGLGGMIGTVLIAMYLPIFMSAGGA